MFATNDPWLGTGHLPDITAVRPIFRGGRPVAYAGCIAHWADIGGAIWSADSREVYEEGLRIPPTRIVAEGKINEDIAEIIKANVRLPEQVLGDLHAQLAALTVTERRLHELLDDLGLDDPAALFAAIEERTETAMRAAIAELPDGTYAHEIEIGQFSGLFPSPDDFLPYHRPSDTVSMRRRPSVPGTTSSRDQGESILP